MKERSYFIEYMGDSPRIRILDFLLDNFNSDFSLPQVAKGSGVAYTTLMEIFPEFVKKEIVIKTREIGKSKLYKINLSNPIVKVLMAIDIRLSEATAIKAGLIPKEEEISA